MPESCCSKHSGVALKLAAIWRRFGTMILLPMAGATNPLIAQEDFQSLELDRPTRLEDAFPLKFREWEFELGTRADAADSGSGIFGLVEVKSGLFLNGEVGLGAEVGAQDGANGDTQSGLDQVAAHVLYSVRRQTWAAPALAVRLDVMTPGTGSLGRTDWGGGLRAMLTRSFGRIRTTGNGGYVVNSAADGGDYLQLGLALDSPVGLSGRMLIGDVYAEIPTGSGRTRVWIEAGTRWQVGNNSVLDFGLATRLDEWDLGNANVELNVGISRVFGIPGLVSVPAYPRPSIR